MGFYNIMYCFSFIESNLNDLLLFGFLWILLYDIYRFWKVCYVFMIYVCV